MKHVEESSFSKAIVGGVRFLDEPAAMFASMLEGWARQQRSRRLQERTIRDRLAFIERFRDFTESYPWHWKPGDVENFTTMVAGGIKPASYSTIRGYHVAIRLFCEYVSDSRYDWTDLCQEYFDAATAQICFEWNTTAHYSAFEGRPNRRPLDYKELQILFDFADSEVDRIATSGKKGTLAALRDSTILKTTYAFGLRRREVLSLETFDLRPNPTVPQWGSYGAIQVRYGKSSKGGPPRRRTVLAVPEFEWAIDGLKYWREVVREYCDPGQRSALWLTERGTSVSSRYIDQRFADLRDRAGLPVELSLHSLRHSYVTHLVEHGYAPKFVQDQVGHASSATTAMYTAVGEEYRTGILRLALDRYNERNPDEES